MTLIKAFKWSFLSELAAKGIQPLAFIILARLLTPEDFGVMTAALMVIAFSQIFWDAGMGKALIQRQHDILLATNAAFITNMCLAAVIGLCLFLSADFISLVIFNEERVGPVLEIMTLHVIFGAFCSVQTALLQKDMEFKKLFWVRLVATACPALASIPLAIAGFGYWALIAGAIIGQFFQAVLLWHLSSWRPSRKVDPDVTKDMVIFGAWVSVTGLLVWAYAWVDSLIVAQFLGTHILGIYRMGSQLPALVFALLLSPLIPVLYSHLSKISHLNEKLKEIAENFIGTLTIIAIPIAIGIFIFSSSIEEIVLGPQWSGTAIVLGVMALTHGFSCVVGMNGEFYRAMGKPSYETIASGILLTIYISSYLLVISSGLVVFVWVRFCLALVALVLHLYVLRRILQVDLIIIFKRMILITLISIISIGITKIIVFELISIDWVRLTIGVLVSTIMTLFLIYIFEKNKSVAYLLSIFKTGSV
ncbi:MAG: hypothetical protein CL855_00800 [Cryomorphaceae bacterium]|nr:hypothetical protein [Cryomorphaceae bacterium]